MLDELICKGGQERLGYYRDHNKILFVNDFNLEKDVQSRKDIFHELLKSRYENLSEDYSRDESEFCIDINVSKDKELIKKIIRYEMNGGNNIFSKCNLI
jgi:hypothetical protein